MTEEEFCRIVLEAVREICAFEDAEQVAAFLLAQGCKGEPVGPCTCPVARFVAKRIDPDGLSGNTLTVAVGADNVTAMDWRNGADEEGGPKLHAYIGFTTSVKEFIHAFDHYGLFSELVEVP